MLDSAKLLGGATLGAALGFVGAIYAKAEPDMPAVIVVFFLGAVAALCLIYMTRASRKEFLNAYIACSGRCGSQIRRRQLWRLPQTPMKGGLAVCSTCFIETVQRAPHALHGDKLAYAKKGKEYENTTEGRRVRREREDLKRMMLEALNAPVTEEYLRANLMDPMGREHPEVRQALDALLKKKAATPADPQSPRPPKHDS